LGYPQDVRFSPESDRIADVPDWQLPGQDDRDVRLVPPQTDIADSIFLHDISAKEKPSKKPPKAALQFKA
jgi:hypothetical protein